MFVSGTEEIHEELQLVMWVFVSDMGKLLAR
jgi:hypothetical protein